MFPASPEMAEAIKADFKDPNRYPVDARGLAYTYVFIALKRLGSRPVYLIAIKDKDGNAFDGSKTYPVPTVPANPPVEQYWSVTAYDRQTHALIRNMSRASRSSQITDMQNNPTAQWMFIWVRQPQLARRRTGFRLTPKGHSTSCSAPMHRQRRSSKKRGSCPISRE